jgi:hypothetical protein
MKLCLILIESNTTEMQYLNALIVKVQLKVRLLVSSMSSSSALYDIFLNSINFKIYVYTAMIIQNE